MCVCVCAGGGGGGLAIRQAIIELYYFLLYLFMLLSAPDYKKPPFMPRF